MNFSRLKPVYDSKSFRAPFVYTLNELYRYRHLVGLLVSRDLKVRYKRSVLGYLWVVLNPLLTMATLAVVFGGLFVSQQKHVITYILTGILLWNLFSQGTVAAMASMQQNSGILRRVYVPPITFVVSAVTSALVNLLFSAVPYIVIVLLDGLNITWNWLFLFVPIVELVMLTAGIGLLLAVLSVFFADTLEIYQVMLQLYFFMNPVMYPINILPQFLLRIQQINPMFYILSTFRMVVIDGRLPSIRLTMGGLAFSILVLIIGWVVFSSYRHRLAYRL